MLSRVKHILSSVQGLYGRFHWLDWFYWLNKDLGLSKKISLRRLACGSVYVPNQPVINVFNHLSPQSLF